MFFLGLLFKMGKLYAVNNVRINKKLLINNKKVVSRTSILGVEDNWDNSLFNKIKLTKLSIISK